MKEVSKIDENVLMLIEYLKNEWERPGAFYKRITVTIKDIVLMKRVIEDNVEVNMEYLNNEKLKFENVMRHLKINYILLRIYKKMREQEMKNSKDVMWFCIDLDKEEAKLYSKLKKENTYTGGR